MAGPTVSLAGAKDRQAWNDYVERRSDGPARALYEWRDLLEQLYPVDAPLFVARRGDGGIAGVLFTYHLRERGHTLYSPPLGLLADDQAAGTALLDAARDCCRDRGLARSIITSGRQSIPASCRRWTKTTVLLPLDGSADEMWKGMRDKTRNMVRKAERNGLKLGRGFDYIDGFYDAYLERLGEKEINLHSRGFFTRLAEVMGDHAELFVAFKEGKVLGGMIFLYSRRTASYLYNACHASALSLGTNNFLMWEAMKDGLERGVRAIELGESTVGGGVYNFKTKGFRGTPVEVHYYDVMGAPGEELAPVAVSPAERLLAASRRLFPVLPAGVRRQILLSSSKFGRLL